MNFFPQRKGILCIPKIELLNFFTNSIFKGSFLSLSRGEEAEKISKFKDAMGLGAEDAAAAHIDVGRRFLRLANEAGKASKGEYRKVLVSFLLTFWAAIFGMLHMHSD